MTGPCRTRDTSVYWGEDYAWEITLRWNSELLYVSGWIGLIWLTTELVTWLGTVQYVFRNVCNGDLFSPELSMLNLWRAENEIHFVGEILRFGIKLIAFIFQFNQWEQLHLTVLRSTYVPRERQYL